MASEATEIAKPVRGRPKKFDRATALQQARDLFWERGYEGTSFDDLIGVMGISPSSFYNSFASKERLYQEACQDYMACASAWFARELGGATDTKTAFHRLLNTAALEFTHDTGPSGCMISTAGTHTPPSLASMRDMMVGFRQAAQVAMAERIRKGIDAGDLSPDTDVEPLAAFYSALSRGMAVQARDGAGRERLRAIVEIGMRAWPDRSAT